MQHLTMVFRSSPSFPTSFYELKCGMSGANLAQKLSSRCLLKSASSEQLPEKLVLYCGFDITSRSLQIGNLVPIRILKIAHDMGHETIALTGSFTTLLGDPSWKNETRPILSQEEIAKNLERIRRQIHSLSDTDHLLDNADWFRGMNLMTFMREIASKISVNQLVAAETFKNRLDNQLHLSFMEFCYSLLQAYDMYHLNQTLGCNLQVGGSDQWFNMTQGISYCRKMGVEGIYCMTSELLVKADGTKMGKSLSGCIYLDKELTSVYDFWQFWRNVDDADVRRCLLQMTDVPVQEVENIVQFDIIEAKKMLADEVTRWVHGKEEQAVAREKSEAIFERGSTEEMEKIAWDFEEEVKLEKLLVKVGLFTSISEAKRQILAGSVTINGIKKLDPNEIIVKNTYVLCFGKKRFLKLM